MKQRVYIETSIVSYLTSRASRDLVTAARQQITSEWWEKNRDVFRLFISTSVLGEAKMGDKDAAQKRLSILNKLTVLEGTPESLNFAKFLIAETPFPVNAQIDALHIAIATVHDMDYILTWNFKHIANAAIRSKLEILAQNKNYTLPVISTPEELLA